jgi:hypothetical protein
VQHRNSTSVTSKINVYNIKIFTSNFETFTCITRNMSKTRIQHEQQTICITKTTKLQRGKSIIATSVYNDCSEPPGEVACPPFAPSVRSAGEQSSNRTPAERHPAPPIHPLRHPRRRPASSSTRHRHSPSPASATTPPLLVSSPRRTWGQRASPLLASFATHAADLGCGLQGRSVPCRPGMPPSRGAPPRRPG